MSYRRICYHIVFCTKNRKPSLSKHNRKTLYKYIWGIIKRDYGVLYQINGTSNHIHLLMELLLSKSLSGFMKVVKIQSNKFIHRNKLFPSFDCWAAGYAAFTHSYLEKENLMKYMKNQEEHHRSTSFIEEYVQLLNENNIAFEEKYLP